MNCLSHERIKFATHTQLTRRKKMGPSITFLRYPQISRKMGPSACHPILLRQTIAKQALFYSPILPDRRKVQRTGVTFGTLCDDSFRYARIPHGRIRRYKPSPYYMDLALFRERQDCVAKTPGKISA